MVVVKFVKDLRRGEVEEVGGVGDEVAVSRG